MKKQYARVLSIAGSDSGGGAGIQADIKSISACGAYAATAVTAITAQNTLGVQQIHPIPVPDLQAQIQSVLSDIGADAIKIGMLHASKVIDGVVESLENYPNIPIILDPVMVATSGDRLLESSAVEALKTNLIPKCTLVTPNIDEAGILLNRPLTSDKLSKDTAIELSEKYGVAVLLKSVEQRAGILADIFHHPKEGKTQVFEKAHLPTPNTHGTGCSLSASIAAYVARGFDLSTAIAKANDYLHQALKAGQPYALGKGKGPVHHFFRWWGEG